MTLEQILKRKDVPDDIKELLKQLYSEKNATKGIDTGDILHSLFERVNDGITIIQDYKIVYMNPRMAEILDYTVEEMIGNVFDKYLPPFEVDRIKDLNKRRMAGEDVPSIYEAVLANKHGNLVNVEINAGLSIYNDKLSNLAIIRDITDRKITQKTLKDSENKYRTLVENLRVGVYRNTPGPEGKFIQINQAMVDIFGYESKSELLNIPVAKHYANPEMRSVYFNELEERKFLRNKELILQKKDGTPFWASITSQVKFNDDGEIIWTDGILEDITDRKISESALIASEEHYRAIIEDQTELICRFMHNLTLTFVNEAYCRYFGMKQEDLVGKSLTDLVIEDDRDMVTNQVKSLNKEYPVAMNEQRVKNKDNEIRWLQWTNRAIFDEDTIIGFQAVGFDITKRKNAEDQLKKQKEETELFLNVLAHDLKNYHATTKGYLDLAIKGRKEPRKIRDFLKKARSGLLRSSTLTSNVSIMLKQQYAYSYKLQAINLSKIIENSKHFIKELYPRKNIIIESSVAEDVFILTDSLIEELLHNLLTNAIKSDTNEEIKILIDHKNISEDRCTVTMTDHGSGIPPDERGTLFDKFSVYRSSGKGSGIGMYIVKTLVERYRGCINIENRVKSDYRKGTKVILEFGIPETK